MKCPGCSRTPISTQALAPRLHTSRMRLQHRRQPQARIRFHIVSLRFTDEAVDYSERGLCSRRVLTVAAQTLFSQLQVTLRNRNLVGVRRNLIPKRLKVTHLFSLWQFVETRRCLKGSPREQPARGGSVCFETLGFESVTRDSSEL